MESASRVKQLRACLRCSNAVNHWIGASSKGWASVCISHVVSPKCTTEQLAHEVMALAKALSSPCPYPLRVPYDWRGGIGRTGPLKSSHTAWTIDGHELGIFWMSQNCLPAASPKVNMSPLGFWRRFSWLATCLLTTRRRHSTKSDATSNFPYDRGILLWVSP